MLKSIILESIIRKSVGILTKSALEAFVKSPASKKLTRPISDFTSATVGTTISAIISIPPIKRAFESAQQERQELLLARIRIEWGLDFNVGEISPLHEAKNTVLLNTSKSAFGRAQINSQWEWIELKSESDRTGFFFDTFRLSYPAIVCHWSDRNEYREIAYCADRSLLALIRRQQQG